VDERESLGKYLKRERENRKISLKEVSKQIKVREPFLRAVEEDRRDLLPSVTYVKGFLSAYAKYLGLDPNEVILRYEAESKGEPIIRPEALPEKRILWNPKYLWMIGGVIIVGFIVLYLLLSPSQQPVVPLPPKPEAKKPIPQAPPPPVSEKPSALGEKGISLGVKAVERTWVAIQIDGQPVREATFQPGESFTYRAAKRIEVVVGNAGGLDMTFNERRLEKIGESGEVVTVILTPQGVEIKHREPAKPSEE
jgi:transcriptional regulator with XRE-family HTH domain